MNIHLENTDSQLVLNKIVLEYMREQKRKRRWRWVLRILLVLIALWGSYQLMMVTNDDASSLTKPHVGLIDIKGTIFANQEASGDNLSKGLEKAYDNKYMKALILRIDSPGGSPVQADYMYSAIRHYHEKFPKIKIYAVCVDTCASAAYYLAAAADEIYANPASIVGSIGVIYNGFGFVDAMRKLGVTRRLQTAGRNKGFMDQFSPMNLEQQKTLQTILDMIHQQFIAKVKEGRGKRLIIDNDTFSGLFWTGTQAKERGLIDGFASSGQLARDVIKIERMVDYTFKENVLERFSKNIGTAMAEQLPTALGIKPGIRSQESGF
ncbi:MAG: S49 family peptidase [Legionella sp.]